MKNSQKIEKPKGCVRTGTNGFVCSRTSASSFLKHNIVRIERQKFEVLKKLLVDKKSQ